MFSSIIFIIVTLIAGYFAYKSISKIRRNIFLGKPENRSDNPKLRLKNMAMVALGQSKIVKRPIAGFFHVLVYAGFILINIEVLEIIIDGITGKHRIFMPMLGSFYGFLIGFFEILSALVIISCFVFLYRRNILKVKRFTGTEMTKFPLFDGNIILVIEIILMAALLKMNAADVHLQNEYSLPISSYLHPFFSSFSESTNYALMKTFWWFHWIGILIFINYIPYSKHLHIFMAFPNTYYANLTPKGKVENMESVTTEVNLMLNPNFPIPDNYESPSSFGVKDIEDLTWKNLMDAYSCTECGRCTSVCPANQTGKLLSPRKIMMDTRDRLEEKGKLIDIKNTEELNAQNLHSKISSEELWACTSCNACVEACPVNINPLEIILKMRQYLVMEQSSAPAELNNMFNNVENNGAPWQFSPSDRANWTNN